MKVTRAARVQHGLPAGSREEHLEAGAVPDHLRFRSKDAKPHETDFDRRAACGAFLFEQHCWNPGCVALDVLTEQHVHRDATDLLLPKLPKAGTCDSVVRELEVVKGIDRAPDLAEGADVEVVSCRCRVLANDVAGSLRRASLRCGRSPREEDDVVFDVEVIWELDGGDTRCDLDVNPSFLIDGSPSRLLPTTLTVVLRPWWTEFIEDDPGPVIASEEEDALVAVAATHRDGLGVAPPPVWPLPEHVAPRAFLRQGA